MTMRDFARDVLLWVGIWLAVNTLLYLACVAAAPSVNRALNQLLTGDMEKALSAAEYQLPSAIASLSWPTPSSKLTLGAVIVALALLLASRRQQYRGLGLGGVTALVPVVALLPASIPFIGAWESSFFTVLTICGCAALLLTASQTGVVKWKRLAPVLLIPLALSIVLDALGWVGISPGSQFLGAAESVDLLRDVMPLKSVIVSWLVPCIVLAPLVILLGYLNTVDAPPQEPVGSLRRGRTMAVYLVGWALLTAAIAFLWALSGFTNAYMACGSAGVFIGWLGAVAWFGPPRETRLLLLLYYTLIPITYLLLPYATKPSLPLAMAIAALTVALVGLSIRVSVVSGGIISLFASVALMIVVHYWSLLRNELSFPSFSAAGVIPLALGALVYSAPLLFDAVWRGRAPETKSIM